MPSALCIKSLKQILRTKYDQYHSLILPLQKYLADNGVQFVADTTVTDMDIEIDGKNKTVKALMLLHNGEESVQKVGEEDMVFFTNGSMTQNSTRGSMTEAPVMNMNQENKGCFTLWEKLAAKSEDFGHPEKFAFDPMKTNFVSTTITIKDYPFLMKYLSEKDGNVTGSGGVKTFVHSPWYISYNAPIQPVDPNQPENVQVLWLYGLHSNEIGECVKKPMTECSGEEVLKEFCYWCGLEDKYEEIKEHCIAIPTVMPYITSQFMPRGLKDRPLIIPEGSKNLAFIGQFVELPGDVVFTVETSVRTAMTAVYRMTHLDRPVDPLFQGQYDIRMLKAGVLTMTGKESLELKDFPKINPLEIKSTLQSIKKLFDDIPDVPAAYSERWENQ